MEGVSWLYYFMKEQFISVFLVFRTILLCSSLGWGQYSGHSDFPSRDNKAQLALLNLARLHNY